MKSFEEVQFSGKRALIRVDFNVPLNSDFNITDETRLKACIPTIKKILNDGGSTVLMSHLGRPKSGPEEKYSLKHLIGWLEKEYGVKVHFADDCVGEKAEELSSQLKGGEILLLENLRFHKEETAGDEGFAQQLAKHGDIYVNDAFGTAHRAHASTSIVAQYFEEKCAGAVMKAELDNADKVLGNPNRPFTAIMGGAKISDKILIIEKLLDKVDNLIIGGGMSYTFTKALGGEIGTSLLEADKMPLALELMEKAKAKGVNLILPEDTVIANDFNKDAKSETVESNAIPSDWMGLDIGPKTRKNFDALLKDSKTILWNGPMGVFEFPRFAKGTESVAQSVVEATQKGAFSLIGGGDSASAVNNLGFGDQVSYVSTGGGALLEYMEGKELPGVKALND
ncbi:MAG: phosphoglycerate kinase [Cyclobacteriaceae bacterium]|nr:phosphoglycerate kinase [Cyclobacteriaceae bacterium]MCH8515711.1 phosphoglycerate kinase [Cyclobacteriaceae bacterium]